MGMGMTSWEWEGMVYRPNSKSHFRTPLLWRRKQWTAAEKKSQASYARVTGASAKSVRCGGADWKMQDLENDGPGYSKVRAFA